VTHEEQLRRNLKHAFELFDTLLDDPRELEAIPDGITVVAMPSGDPELCTANEVMLRTERLQSASPHGDRESRPAFSSSTLLVNV
jgi:hypothetical protein